LSYCARILFVKRYGSWLYIFFFLSRGKFFGPFLFSFILHYLFLPRQQKGAFGRVDSTVVWESKTSVRSVTPRGGRRRTRKLTKKWKTSPTPPEPRRRGRRGGRFGYRRAPVERPSAGSIGLVTSRCIGASRCINLLLFRDARRIAASTRGSGPLEDANGAWVLVRL